MSKKSTVQDTASTAVLMNLQRTINHLSDSLNTSFSTSEETHVADSRSRVLKIMQSEPELSKEDKVVVINIFMNSPAVKTLLNRWSGGAWLQLMRCALYLSTCP
jgi:hypothetical protein